ncbi:hypothetical protein GCM10027416_25570 [Okibacterium endophyticum]
MFVLTADQIDSRHTRDIVDDMLRRISDEHTSDLVLAPDRTAGDELQVITASARTAMSLITMLTRTEQWSVGVGIGSVRRPLPEATREATGSAFYAARDAVTRAKKSAVRFALSAESPESGARADDDGEALRGDDAEALVTLLIMLRDKRTDGGWELFDLLQSGLSQADAAERIGITAGAVSLRARTAGIRAEEAASEALVRLLMTIDHHVNGDER